MLDPKTPLAIYMEGSLTTMIAKMGLGVLRYSQNPIVCVIDSEHAGGCAEKITGIPRKCPVVASVREAVELGAQAMILGIAPPGGRIPENWLADLDQAVSLGMSLVNGLHDPLTPRYTSLAPGQWVWDLRVEPADLSVGTGGAAGLSNRRVLTIGTDMAIGKMTAGLELHRRALEKGMNAEFVATGQIGIAITGRGVPLDAVRLDYASGAIEREVMAAQGADLVLVEGQGALSHPASVATLALLRGACPTHLVLCHKAGMTHLQKVPHIAVPELRPYIRLYEELAEVCGTYPRPRCVGLAINTSHLPPNEAWDALRAFEHQIGLPCVDPLRFGADRLLEAILH